MLTNYIYAFRLNEYNIKIKSHIVLKHIYIYIYRHTHTHTHPLHSTHLLFDFYNIKVFKENKDI